MQWVSDYSSWVYVLIVLLSGAIVYWTYWKQPRKIFKKTQRIVLSILRFSVFILLGFIIFSPLLLILEHKVEKPIMIIAMDHSRSVGKSLSKNELQNIYDQISKGIDSWGEDIRLDTLTFGDQVRKSLHGPLDETRTDISALSTYVSDRYYESSLREILLITDGYSNFGTNPFGEDYHLDVPVSVVPIGDTMTAADFAVELVQAPNSILRPNDIIVDAELSCKNSLSKSAQVQLLLDGRIIKSDRINFQYEDDLIARQYIVSSPSSGNHSICVRIISNEQEYHLANNQKCSQVKVTDEKVKIALCYESPHPDVAAISRALHGQKSIILTKYSRVPTSFSEDVIIAHNIKAPSAVDHIIKSGKPYWLIAGLYTNAQLWAADDGVREVAAKASEVRPVLNPNFSYFDKSFVDENLITSMPPLVSGRFILDFSTASQDLLLSSTDQPLFAYQAGKKSRAITAGEGLWRWRVQNHRSQKNTQMFDALIQQTVLFLRPSARKNSFEIRINKTSVPIGVPLSWSAQFFNQNLELDNTPEVKISIKGAGISRELQMNKTKDAYILIVDKLPPGSYTYSATLSGAKIKKTSSGKFEVQNVDIEAAIPHANMSLLKSIVYPSQGKFYPKSSIDQWFDDIRTKEYPDTIVNEQSWRKAIDLRWLAALLMFLLILEWVLRKLWGSV